MNRRMREQRFRVITGNSRTIISFYQRGLLPLTLTEEEVDVFSAHVFLQNPLDPPRVFHCAGDPDIVILTAPLARLIMRAFELYYEAHKQLLTFNYPLYKKAYALLHRTNDPYLQEGNRIERFTPSMSF